MLFASTAPSVLCLGWQAKCETRRMLPCFFRIVEAHQARAESEDLQLVAPLITGGVWALHKIHCLDLDAKLYLFHANFLLIPSAFENLLPSLPPLKKKAQSIRSSKSKSPTSQAMVAALSGMLDELRVMDPQMAAKKLDYAAGRPSLHLRHIQQKARKKQLLLSWLWLLCLLLWLLPLLQGYVC